MPSWRCVHEVVAPVDEGVSLSNERVASPHKRVASPPDLVASTDALVLKADVLTGFIRIRPGCYPRSMSKPAQNPIEAASDTALRTPRTVSWNGRTLIAIAVIHSLFGFWVGRSTVLELLRGGLFNTVNGQ